MVTSTFGLSRRWTNNSWRLTCSRTTWLGQCKRSEAKKELLWHESGQVMTAQMNGVGLKLPLLWRHNICAGKGRVAGLHWAECLATLQVLGSAVQLLQSHSRLFTAINN